MLSGLAEYCTDAWSTKPVASIEALTPRGQNLVAGQTLHVMGDEARGANDEHVVHAELPVFNATTPGGQIVPGVRSPLVQNDPWGQGVPSVIPTIGQ